MENLTIGKLAKLTELNIETIRYYERIEVLPYARRNASGYRFYSDEDLKRVTFIKKAKNMGFTLNDIKELLEMRIVSDEPCEPVHKLAREKLIIVNEKLKELNRIKIVLKELIGQCAVHEPTEPCPVLRILEN